MRNIAFIDEGFVALSVESNYNKERSVFIGIALIPDVLTKHR